MPHSIKSLILLLVAATFLSSCKSEKISDVSIAEYNPITFSDYQSAETWIKQTHKAETITPESSLIKQIDYYTIKNNGYLIITLKREKSPTLLYQNITPALWEEFKNAESKGKFYNEKIQGNENFTLKLKP